MISFDISKPLNGQDGNVNLQAKGHLIPRQLTVLSGVSGAGKTTLLKILAGLTNVKEGTVINGNMSWGEGGKLLTPPGRRNIAYLHQDFNLFPSMTIAQNLDFANPNASSKELEMLYDRLQLNELVDKRPNQLSGGQKQRAALARALVQQSALYLLDEPLSAQDQGMRAEVIRLLAQYKQEKTAAWLIVTHQKELFEGFADHFWEIEEGKLLENG